MIYDTENFNFSSLDQYVFQDTFENMTLRFLFKQSIFESTLICKMA